MLLTVLILIALILIICFSIYNSLIRVKNKVKNARSQIDVQLKKRYDLVPNLIQTVKGYMKHEKTVLEDITKMRSKAIDTKDISSEMKINDKMSKAISGILNVAVENYPDLKASKNFLMLQEELSGIENKIAYSRQYYNDAVMDYNNRIEMFPTNVFANLLNFKEEKFLETPAEQKKNIKVSF